MKQKPYKTLVVLSLAMLLASCGQGGETQESALTSSDSSTSSIQSSSTSSEEKREDKTYFSWEWDDLKVGETVSQEGVDIVDGGGYIASSQDEDGNVWVRQKDVLDGTMWGFQSSTVKDEKGNQIPLDSWAVDFTTRIPYADADHASDGGITIMASNLIGRYDLALFYSSADAGASSAINLWMSHGPVSYPFATTEQSQQWGDRGSKINNFALYAGEDYHVTVAMKKTGKNERSEDIGNIYIFVDDTLVIAQSGIPYWQGGFGLRGYQSSWEYGSFHVTSFPLVCPDGIDHYNDTPSGEAKTLPVLAMPELTLDNRIVSWPAVIHAEYYDVFDSYGDFVARTYETRLNLEDYFSGTGSCSIIAGNSKFGYLRSLPSSVTFELPNALTAPTLSVKDVTTLTWNSIVGATGYELFYEGESFGVYGPTVTTFDAEGYEEGFQVRALGDGVMFLNSPLSNKVYPSKPLLETPNLRYDGTKLLWDADPLAKEYDLYYNGEKFLTTTEAFFETSDYGTYNVKAISNDITKNKDSELSNSFVVRRVDRVYFNKNFEGVAPSTVIDLSGEGWGIYYNDGRVWETKKAHQDGAMWIGVTDPYPRSNAPDVAKQWSATYFPATNEGVYLTSYTFEADLLLESEGPDGYDFFQHIFATQKTGGRYALDFKVYNTTNKAVIGLYDNHNCYAYVEDVDFAYDVAHKVTINYNLHANKKARISAYIDEVCLFDIVDQPAGIGDFGFSTISGNPMWTNIKVNDMPYYAPDGVDRY